MGYETQTRDTDRERQREMEGDTERQTDTLEINNIPSDGQTDPDTKIYRQQEGKPLLTPAEEGGHAMVVGTVYYL